MAEKLSDRMVESMPWLDDLAATVQQTLAPLLGPDGSKELQDLLNGTWLGHPLHPAVVTAPLGFWMATAVLDLAGMEQGADLALKLGLLSALGAVASGAAQWQDTQGKPRRMGMLHASLNTGAATLYGLSWMLRARGARKMGVTLSMAGLAVGNLSAWLGGDLAYVLGIGINRNAFAEPSTEWVEVLDEGELEENKPRRVEANGVPVMLLRQGGQTYAIMATCSHIGGPLDEGQIEGDTVTCPWHGSVFCVRDGALIHGPATVPQPAFDVQVQNGRIAVRAQEAS